jgi:hypothetical protein
MPSTGKNQNLKDRLRRLSRLTAGFVLERLSKFGRLTAGCVSGGVKVPTLGCLQFQLKRVYI